MDQHTPPYADRCFGGRSDWSSVPMVPQWFARFGDPPADLTLPPIVDLGTFWRPIFDGSRSPPCGTRLWRLTSSVSERHRSGGPLLPLHRDRILGPASGGESASSRSMAYRLRLQLSGEAPPRSVIIDLGQPLEFYAQHCTVALLGPADAQRVDSNVGPSPLSGFVLDTLIGCRLVAIEEAVGTFDALYSQVLTVPPGALAVPVPEGAREVVVYQADDGAPPTAPWGQYCGDSQSLAAAWHVGAIEFSPGQRQSLPGQLIGGVSHLRTDDTPGLTRQFLLVWTIRP